MAAISEYYTDHLGIEPKPFGKLLTDTLPTDLMSQMGKNKFIIIGLKFHFL